MSNSIKPKNHQKRWTNEDEKFLIINYAAGTSMDLVASKLNRTLVSVLHRLTLAGLVEYDKKANAYYSVRALLYQF